MAIEINENSSGILELSFYDEDDQLVVPASITYRIDDSETGNSIKTSTGVSPASTVNISLTPDDNAIISGTLNKEKHIVTVVATYGGSSQKTEEIVVWVKNLTFL